MNSKNLKNISSLELEESLAKKPEQIFLVDVREEIEFTTERISEGHFFPLSQFNLETAKTINQTAAEKKIVFYCKAGKRSLRAAEIFLEIFPEQEVFNLVGGIGDWKRNKLATIPEDLKQTVTAEIILGSTDQFPKARVFYFHTDVTNLQKIHRKSGLLSRFVNLEITRVDYPFEVGSQFEILLRILFLLKISWKLKIIENKPEDYFQDQEVSGLFKSFVHTHYFLEENNQTIIRDQIELDSGSKLFNLFWSFVWRAFLKSKLKTTKAVLSEEFKA